MGSHRVEYDWSDLAAVAAAEAQSIKIPPAVQEMQETLVWALGCQDPLEKEVTTRSSTLAWKIPWTEEPGRLQSMQSQRAGLDWATKPPVVWLDESREQSGLERRETGAVDRREAPCDYRSGDETCTGLGAVELERKESHFRGSVCYLWVPTLRWVLCFTLLHV